VKIANYRLDHDDEKQIGNLLSDSLKLNIPLRRLSFPIFIENDNV